MTGQEPDSHRLIHAIDRQMKTDGFLKTGDDEAVSPHIRNQGILDFRKSGE